MKHFTRVSVANGFGTLGYLSVLFQWTWALLLLLYPLMTENPDFFLPKHPAAPQVETPELGPIFTPVVTIVAVVITILVLILTAIVLVRLPKAVGKKAATVTRATAQNILPTLTQHKKISKAKREKLSYRIIVVLKCALVALPLFALLFMRPLAELSANAIWTIALFSASCSIFYFVIQQVIAWLGKIPSSKLW